MRYIKQHALLFTFVAVHRFGWHSCMEFIVDTSLLTYRRVACVVAQSYINYVFLVMSSVVSFFPAHMLCLLLQCLILVVAIAVDMPQCERLLFMVQVCKVRCKAFQKASLVARGRCVDRHSFRFAESAARPLKQTTSF